ncbi:hypothetical protein HDU85_000219 [Gaertneriomyces sp. JEL0708]|nr:hypothetical protein HDU85_000219 [Gaertneriomyces sp. JEL0708]
MSTKPTHLHIPPSSHSQLANLRPHPLNPDAQRLTSSLGDAAGLTNLGIHHVRLAPNTESTVLHRHMHDEEWIYILSGRGVALIEKERPDDKYEGQYDVEVEEIPIGPNDFLGFKRSGRAHNLRCVGDEELVYLCGGTRNKMDVVEYPNARKVLKMERHGSERRMDYSDVPPATKE